MADEDPLDELQKALIIDELQKALIRKFAPWLVALVAGSTVMGGSGVLRVDKYGRSDAEVDRQEIEHRIDILESKVGVINYRLDKKQKDINRLIEYMNNHLQVAAKYIEMIERHINRDPNE